VIPLWTIKLTKQHFYTTSTTIIHVLFFLVGDDLVPIWSFSSSFSKSTCILFIDFWMPYHDHSWGDDNFVVESDCFFSSVVKVIWKRKHPWSKPFPNRNTSMSPFLMLKNVTSGKYSPISTTSALQKAKGLTWGSFPVKTSMFIACILLHCFLLWSSIIHIFMKLLFLSMQVMMSFPLYSTSPISLLSLPSDAGRGSGNQQWLSLFTSNAKTLLFQVRQWSDPFTYIFVMRWRDSSCGNFTSPIASISK